MQYSLILKDGSNNPIANSNVVIFPADANTSIIAQAVFSGFTDANGFVLTSELQPGVMYAFTETSDDITSGTFFASLLAAPITITPSTNVGSYPGAVSGGVTSVNAQSGAVVIGSEDDSVTVSPGSPTTGDVDLSVVYPLRPGYTTGGVLSPAASGTGTAQTLTGGSYTAMTESSATLDYEDPTSYNSGNGQFTISVPSYYFNGAHESVFVEIIATATLPTGISSSGTIALRIAPIGGGGVLVQSRGATTYIDHTSLASGTADAEIVFGALLDLGTNANPAIVNFILEDGGSILNGKALGIELTVNLLPVD